MWSGQVRTRQDTQASSELSSTEFLLVAKQVVHTGANYWCIGDSGDSGDGGGAGDEGDN